MYDFGLDRRRRRMITRGFGRMDNDVKNGDDDDNDDDNEGFW